MEYLMTYGWAILIIAVVLGALFSLGVFSGGALLGTSCVAGSGYVCQNPVMGLTGQLSFTFGQNTGSSIYDTNLACAATANSAGLPAASGSPWVPIGTIGNSGTGNTANELVSGQTVSVAGLTCYSGVSGNANMLAAYGSGGSVPIGTPFSGALYVSYATTEGGPTLYAKVATVTVKIS